MTSCTCCGSGLNSKSSRNPIGSRTGQDLPNRERKAPYVTPPFFVFPSTYRMHSTRKDLREVTPVKVNRREFLHRVGAGSIALASLPALMDMFKLPALAQSERGALFLCVNAAGPAAPGRHMIAMGGFARFDPSRGPGSPFTGGGSFFHWTASGSPPFPIVASGNWKGRLLTSYKEVATYGGGAAGVGEYVIDIQRLRPSPALIRGAVLTIYCTLGPAGVTEAQTGGAEGYTLSIPGTEFSAGGNPGIFRQVGAGLTIFLLPESMA